MVSDNRDFTYTTGVPEQTFENSNYYVDVVFTPAPSAPRHLIISFNPPNPSIPSNAAPGTVVATISAAWSDGTPFAGALGFGPPYSNGGGVFAISGDKLIINPEGAGVSALSGTTQNVSVTVTGR